MFNTKKKLFALMALMLGFFSLGAMAESPYPNRPLRMVIPWPPGQATDLVGRVIAMKLTELLGVQVVADNRAGAGGMIGTDIVAKAAPDGYTLLAASSGPVTINPLFQKVPYNAERDLSPVANAGISPYLLTTMPTFPVKDIQELIALLKANPGKYSYASSGTGATGHLVVEYFNNSLGIKGTHVPYKGAIPALTDVMSGQVVYITETVAASMPFVRSGKLRAYGISLDRPSSLAPGIPPISIAANLPGFNAAAWIGVMVSAGTPKPLVNKLTAAVDRALKLPEVLDRLNAVGLEPDYQNAVQMAQLLKDQTKRFSQIIQQSHIKIN
jgi:tripartite-type tricarboxylate transporter receptor subunit TctC